MKNKDKPTNKCRWNHGMCPCGCNRVVCEHLGDDVSISFCDSCYEMQLESDVWKKIIKDGGSSYLSFGRTLTNKVWAKENKRTKSVPQGVIVNNRTKVRCDKCERLVRIMKMFIDEWECLHEK